MVQEQVKFEPSGQTWKRPNWTNFGFVNATTNGGLWISAPNAPQTTLTGGTKVPDAQPFGRPAKFTKSEGYVIRTD